MRIARGELECEGPALIAIGHGDCATSRTCSWRGMIPVTCPPRARGLRAGGAVTRSPLSIRWRGSSGRARRSWWPRWCAWSVLWWWVLRMRRWWGSIQVGGRAQGRPLMNRCRNSAASCRQPAPAAGAARSSTVSAGVGEVGLRGLQPFGDRRLKAGGQLALDAHGAWPYPRFYCTKASRVSP